METESLPTTYTCITCRVAFKDPEIQRQHYKTDWHRYNLKRKVAELPPVTAENFQTKVIIRFNLINNLVLHLFKKFFRIF